MTLVNNAEKRFGEAKDLSKSHTVAFNGGLRQTYSIASIN